MVLPAENLINERLLVAVGCSKSAVRLRPDSVIQRVTRQCLLPGKAVIQASSTGVAAVGISMSGQAHGKLVLEIDPVATAKREQS